MRLLNTNEEWPSMFNAKQTRDSHSSRKCRGTQLHVPSLDSSLSNVYTTFCIEHHLYFLMIIYSQLLLYSPQPNSIILYYTLIYPFLTYTLTAWGSTYPLTLKPLVTLQKKKQLEL